MDILRETSYRHESIRDLPKQVQRGSPFPLEQELESFDASDMCNYYLKHQCTSIFRRKKSRKKKLQNRNLDVIIGSRESL